MTTTDVLYLSAVERQGERCLQDEDLRHAVAHLRSGGTAVVKGLVTAAEAGHIRQVCRDWARREPPSNPCITTRSRNFHRIDQNPEKSKVKCIMHGFTFFYWDDSSKPVSGYFRRVFKVRNQLSDLPLDYALDDIRDGMISRPIVQHYPRGGGYMAEHVDPDMGQKVVLSTVLSELNADFFSGGLFFRDPAGEKVYADRFLNIGDTFVFPPKLSHGVDPIDGERELDWCRPDGRWMMFSSLVTLASLNGSEGHSSTSINAY